MIRTFFLAAALSLPLAACAGDPEPDEADSVTEAAIGEESLASAIPGDSKFAAAMKTAGLDTLFEGPEPYTVLLAPDDAFPDDLPDDAEELASILTLHILPGTILGEDIERALEGSEDGSVTLPSYGGTDLTVTREGEALMIGAGGTPTRLVPGDALSDGALHRIDALLVPAG